MIMLIQKPPWKLTKVTLEFILNVISAISSVASMLITLLKK